VNKNIYQTARDINISHCRFNKIMTEIKQKLNKEELKNKETSSSISQIKIVSCENIDEMSQIEEELKNKLDEIDAQEFEDLDNQNSER